MSFHIPFGIYNNNYISFIMKATDGGKFSSLLRSVNLQSDGKILVGGDFVSYSGVTGRDNLIRLNSDGTLDTSFCANATDGSKFTGWVSVIEVQSDGKILVGGNFTNYAGVTGRNRLVRLNSDGTVDKT